MGQSSSLRAEWRRMAVIALVSAVAFGSGCAGAGDQSKSLLPGSSIASATLQRDTLRLVSIYENTNEEDCEDIQLTDTEVLSMPDAWGKSSWTEKWTVNRCGKLVYYEIVYTPRSERPGTDIVVSPIAQE